MTEKDTTKYGARNLEEVQDVFLSLLKRPLKPDYRLDLGAVEKSEIESLVKPNSKLSAISRLEIYAQQYWYRLIDSLSEDFPGIRRVLGEEKFRKLLLKYLDDFPSSSYLMRDLGKRMPEFVLNNKELCAPRFEIVYDLARFEWAQLYAFDAAALKPVTLSDIERGNVEEMQFELQPHVTLLNLSYALDDFSIALKSQIRNAQTSEALVNQDNFFKQEIDSLSEEELPRAEKIFLVVHRHDNQIYFKRLDEEAYKLLNYLGRDRLPLEQACARLIGEMPEEAIDSKTLSSRLTAWFSTWARLEWLVKSENPETSAIAVKKRLESLDEYSGLD